MKQKYENYIDLISAMLFAVIVTDVIVIWFGWV